mmetsp:Transcript_6708/g.16198  ORF Transcript_6708/g.16198 Transcript_6708/m.16198 type:complete len:216 (-) Transcript_6708:939-1586(-)
MRGGCCLYNLKSHRAVACGCVSPPRAPSGSAFEPAATTLGTAAMCSAIGSGLAEAAASPDCPSLNPGGALASASGEGCALCTSELKTLLVLSELLCLSRACECGRAPPTTRERVAASTSTSASTARERWISLERNTGEVVNPTASFAAPPPPVVAELVIDLGPRTLPSGRSWSLGRNSEGGEEEGDAAVEISACVNGSRPAGGLPSRIPTALVAL